MRDGLIIMGFVVILFGLGFLVGSKSGQAGERDRATAAGAGRWTINPTNGTRTFVYGTPRVVYVRDFIP